MSFPRYPKYKPSGTDWLGDVPEHWEIVLGRRLFSQERDSALESDEQLSATQKYGVVPQKLFMELEDQKVTLALSGLENFRHVEIGDFVISLRSFQGGIERSEYSGCVSPAYTVLRASAPIAGRFWAHLLKSKNYIEALQSVTDGIRDGKNISYQQFGQIGLPLPPLAEQTQIANFLDRETAKIDALVSEQRRLIELLKEKRQAVISHAVTRGLNSSAPLKPSGIDWLGDVPAHWKIKPLKYLVTLKSGGTPSKDNLAYWDGEIPWASSKDLKFEELSDTQDHITQQALNDDTAELLPAGSILTVVRGMILLHTFPVTVTTAPMAINQDLKALTARSTLEPEFLAWLLRGASAEILNRTDEAAHGTKVLRLETWLSMQMPVPSIKEQQQIVATIRKQMKELDALAAEAERAITLLQERRTALISATITGQIDVRDKSSRTKMTIT